MTSKSVQEVVEKQTEYAKSAFDEYVSELNKMSELMAGFTKDAMKPFNERVSAVSSIMQNGRLR
ncbi:MAG: phasin family protein [Alphaproteobacteria bacterium]